MPKSSVQGHKIAALVDDDASYRKATDRLLRTYGWQTHCFESAVDFLATKDKETYDCLLLDIHMPELTGCDLLQRIRSEGDTTPCLLVTAHRLNESQNAIARKFAYAVLGKPSEVSELMDALNGATRTTAP